MKPRWASMDLDEASIEFSLRSIVVCSAPSRSIEVLLVPLRSIEVPLRFTGGQGRRWKSRNFIGLIRANDGALYVADTGNCRVMRWGLPAEPGAFFA